MYMHILLIIIAYFISLHFKSYPHSKFLLQTLTANPLPSDFMRVYAHPSCHLTALNFLKEWLQAFTELSSSPPVDAG